nr:putative ribonuclease H-like domain-containing protein [Tanacetum cinerariifolium]
MEQPNPTFAKIPILDTEKFKQWKFRIQQYLQNEHYALWEVIEFGDSYEAPQEESGTGSASESSAKKKGMTVAVTTEDVQKRRNDVKARTTLLLALPDEHQLRFSKYKSAQEFADVAAASISHDTVCAYIASQSNGSHIKYEDINQIDEDDIEEMDIKWNMTLLRSAGHPGAKTGDWSYMANEKENHALVADEEAPTEFALMAKSSSSSENEIKKEKEGLDSKLTVFKSASKDLDTLLESQRSDKNKEGLGYSVVPPPHAQVYSPPKKDMSWTGLLEFVDDTITDYSRPSPSIESNSSDLQNSNSSISEHGESSESIMSKPMIKFVKAVDRPIDIKTNKVEAARKPSIKYAEMYRNTHKSPKGNSQNIIDDKGYWDSGCSRHITGNISYLSNYEPYDGGYVSFGQGGGKITGKGIIKTGKLEFENVYFVKDLKYNLFSVSQICDNKNSVLFTDSICIVLGRDFKLKDDTNMLLRTPGQHNMYSIDLNNIVPHKDLTCLVAKASADESMLWHRRLGLLNFKTMNKLVRHNLVKGLPSKCFKNDHTCVACLKGKQHKASCKNKLVNLVSKPLHTLHMDLFGHTSVSSLNHKWYCLVMTDDFSRFT